MNFLTGCLFSSLDVCSNNKVGIPKRFNVALKAVKAKKNVCFTRSDKASQLVILDRVHYRKKLDAIS